MTNAVGALSIGEEGVTQRVTLPYVGRLLRVELLLGNPSFGLQGNPPLPIIRVKSAKVPWREVEATSSMKYAVAPDWFLVRVEPRDEFVDRAFTLEVSAPEGAGWIWNGDAMSVQGFSVNAGDRWIEVWAVPSEATRGTVLRLTEDYHLEQAYSIGDSASLRDVSLVLSRPFLRSPPLISLELDVRQRGRPRPLLLVGIGAASASYLALFMLLTIRVTRWGADESQVDRPTPK
jgi:hypothetical protein